ARAITIGVGAGAVEALLLGIAPVATAVVLMLVRGPETDKAIAQVEEIAATTPLYWLAGPVARITAILCHSPTRGLILLGGFLKKYRLVLGGFLLFTLLDGVAGGAHVAGLIGKVSLWWIELAILPFAIVSVPILVWCYRRQPKVPPDATSLLAMEPDGG